MFRVLVSVFFLLSSSLFSAPAYERLWERLLASHTQTKIESGVPYVYVDYTGLHASQSFLSLKRIMTRMNVQDLKPNEAFAFLVNHYHVLMLDNVATSSEINSAAMMGIRNSLKKRESRADFVLSDVFKHAPNLRFFSSVSPNTQVENAVLEQIQKCVDVDSSVQILRIHSWLVAQVPNQTELRAMLKQGFPAINFGSYSLHTTSSAPVSNVLKRKRR